MFYLLIHAIDIFISPPTSNRRGFLLNVRCKSFRSDPNCLSGPFKMITVLTGKEAGYRDKGGVKESTCNPLPKISAGVELYCGGDEKKNWQGKPFRRWPPTRRFVLRPAFKHRAGELSLRLSAIIIKKKVSSSWTRRSFFLLPRSGRRSSQNECRHE